MFESSIDMVFTLLIVAAAIFYSSRHFLRKDQLPEFLESLLTNHTKALAFVLLGCVVILVFFGLFSILYTTTGQTPGP